MTTTTDLTVIDLLNLFKVNLSLTSGTSVSEMIARGCKIILFEHSKEDKKETHINLKQTKKR